MSGEIIATVPFLRSDISDALEFIRRTEDRGEKAQGQFARSVGPLSSEALASKKSGSKASARKPHLLDDKVQFSSESKKIVQTAASEQAEDNAERNDVEPAPVPSFSNDLTMSHSNSYSAVPTGPRPV